MGNTTCAEQQLTPTTVKNPCVRTYTFPSLAKQVLIFGGSYWQFRLNKVLNQVLKFSVETISVQAEKIGLVLYDTAFIYNCLVMSLVQEYTL